MCLGALLCITGHHCGSITLSQEQLLYITGHEGQIGTVTDRSINRRLNLVVGGGPI